jgi:hypothetical protein
MPVNKPPMAGRRPRIIKKTIVSTFMHFIRVFYISYLAADGQLELGAGFDDLIRSANYYTRILLLFEKFGVVMVVWRKLEVVYHGRAHQTGD